MAAGVAFKYSCSRYISSPEWASLPLLPVFLILDNLFEPIDHVSFAAVCKQWRSLAKDYNQATQRWRHNNLLPMLLIPNEYERQGSGSKNSRHITKTNHRKALYSIAEGKIYNNIGLEVPFKKRSCGSSHCWFATIESVTDQGPIIALRDPFRNPASPILLPLLDVRDRNHGTCFFEFYIRKVILSADPVLNPDNYAVVAIFRKSNLFAFIHMKRGQCQKDWTLIRTPCPVTDVISYKNQVYLVEYQGDIMSLDVDNQACSRIRIKPLTPLFENFRTHGSTRYLVESTKGDLMHIVRVCKQTQGAYMNVMTESFRVYKAVFDDKDGSILQQVEVKSIGDDAFFIGDNHSVSVLASNFHGCQSNSIYYTHDFSSSYYTHRYDFRDMGIFNLESGTITQHFSLGPYSDLQGYIQPVVWVVPQFNGLC
ncbi:probable F-box protein At1g44080 [Prunus avium]|uniref:Probable F-box protein At1g44080 n=1 Tax=Prunus avium TaxID=42229 RepID=A0A6P5RIQ0_PRUAV|nr:probable F-box protein At1g44080 [Prunus avium]